MECSSCVLTGQLVHIFTFKRPKSEKATALAFSTDSKNQMRNVCVCVVAPLSNVLCELYGKHEGFISLQKKKKVLQSDWLILVVISDDKMHLQVCLFSFFPVFSYKLNQL